MDWDAVSGITSVIGIVIALVPYIPGIWNKIRSQSISPNYVVFIRWWSVIIASFLCGVIVDRTVLSSAAQTNIDEETQNLVLLPMEDQNLINNWKQVHYDRFISNNIEWDLPTGQNESNGSTYRASLERKLRIELGGGDGGIGGHFLARRINPGNNFYVQATFEKPLGLESSGYGFMFRYNIN